MVGLGRALNSGSSDPSTARTDGPVLGRHRPIKPNVFIFFNLVRYRLYIVVIFRVYVVK
jgi:hypothetical protein